MLNMALSFSFLKQAPNKQWAPRWCLWDRVHLPAELCEALGRPEGPGSKERTKPKQSRQTRKPRAPVLPERVKAHRLLFKCIISLSYLKIREIAETEEWLKKKYRAHHTMEYYLAIKRKEVLPCSSMDQSRKHCTE